MMLDSLKIKFEAQKKNLFEILKNPNFFCGGFNLSNYSITFNKNEAQDLYETQDPDYAIYSSYPDLLEDRTPLTYLFEGMCVEEEEKAEYLWKDYKKELWDLIILQQKEKKDLFPDEFTDFVYNDFLTFAAYRIFSQQKDEFIEQQIEVYQNGGFPCGWKGEYPNGEMVVYSPK
ncbi:hypothetical protein [Neisseria sp. 74A18]|uniref:hypothetical protein n=1 Tax=Neisseria sp. 74A18 TaxID=1696094 RepID=UPI0006CAF0C3|nr:hypothetical protein [Neisseria sp. 74A18]KPN72865.1 hypothetical protein AKG43_10990 [Neisseria sp. 74A18]